MKIIDLTKRQLNDQIELYQNRVETVIDYISNQDGSSEIDIMEGQLQKYRIALQSLKIEQDNRKLNPKIKNNKLIKNEMDLKSKFDDSGKSKIEGSIKDGIKEGVFNNFDEDGLLTSSTHYKKGIETYFELYYKNGTICQRGNRNGGKWDGDHESYYENGQLEFVTRYKNGVLHGLSEMYYNNGQLECIGNFKNNKRIGTYEEYDKSGELTLKREY